MEALPPTPMSIEEIVCSLVSTSYLCKVISTIAARPTPQAIIDGLRLSGADWAALAESCGVPRPADGGEAFVAAPGRALEQEPRIARRVRAILCACDPWTAVEGIAEDISEAEFVDAQQAVADDADGVLAQPSRDDVDVSLRRDLSLTWLCRTLLAATEADQPTCHEVEIDLVSVHPDAGFPEAAPGLPNRAFAELWLTRRFLLRALVEAGRLGASVDGPIERFLARWQIDALCSAADEQFDDVATFIVWHAERIHYTPLGVDDTFWHAHRDAWWAEARLHGASLREALREPSDHQPYAVARYRVRLHPCWTDGLTDDVFESVAHWS